MSLVFEIYFYLNKKIKLLYILVLFLKVRKFIKLDLIVNNISRNINKFKIIKQLTFLKFSYIFYAKIEKPKVFTFILSFPAINLKNF